jgi:hypothetical protein
MMTHQISYWPFGLYGQGMHDFIIREIEIGQRAALFEDMETCGDSALDDLSYAYRIQVYPTFDDDPADWGLSPGKPITEAEMKAAEYAEVFGDAWDDAK